MRSSPMTIETMYRCHGSWLLARLQRKLGNRWDAADLVQNTFLKVLTSFDAATVAEPRAVLTTVARSIWIDQLRRQALERAYLEALAQQPENLVPPPEVRLIAIEALVEIDRMLDGLPLQAKQAFLMARIEGLSLGEIAAALGTSLATVKRRIAQAAARCYFGL